MKKILNLTRNEMEDVVAVKVEQRTYWRENPDGITLRGAATSYTLAKPRPLWSKDDSYKVIDV